MWRPYFHSLPEDAPCCSNRTHLLRSGIKDMGLIDMAQDWNRWRALVNAVMKLRVHKMRGIFRIAEDLLASHEGVCFMELGS